MNKIAIFAAAVVAVAMTGCSCWCPKDDNCMKTNHDIKATVTPDAVSFNQAVVLPVKEAFRPVYTAGTKRISVTGKGMTRDQAFNEAVSKACLEYNCDMLAAAKAVVTKITHPYWIFFSYETYQVHLSGMPITMTALAKEAYVAPVAKPVAPVVKPVVVECKGKACQPAAMVTLSNIKLQMTADGATSSKVAVKVPGECKK